MCQDVRGTCCPPIKPESNGVNQLSTIKRRLFGDSWGRRRLFLNFAPEGTVFRNRFETDPESRDNTGVGSKNGSGDENRGDGPVGALSRCETEPEARGGDGSGGEAHYMVEVHGVLAHPREEITHKTAQAMGSATTGQSGSARRACRRKQYGRRSCGLTGRTRLVASVLAMRTSASSYVKTNQSEEEVLCNSSSKYRSWSWSSSRHHINANRKYRRHRRNLKKGRKRRRRIPRRRYKRNHRILRRRYGRYHRIARKK